MGGCLLQLSVAGEGEPAARSAFYIELYRGVIGGIYYTTDHPPFPVERVSVHPEMPQTAGLN